MKLISKNFLIPILLNQPVHLLQNQTADYALKDSGIIPYDISRKIIFYQINMMLIKNSSKI